MLTTLAYKQPQPARTTKIFSGFLGGSVLADPVARLAA
jgi:hypothetical protein